VSVADFEDDIIREGIRMVVGITYPRCKVTQTEGRRVKVTVPETMLDGDSDVIGVVFVGNLEIFRRDFHVSVTFVNHQSYRKSCDP